MRMALPSQRIRRSKPQAHGDKPLTRDREIRFTAGVSEPIYLKHNETMTINGIPLGYKYYVEEGYTDTDGNWHAIDLDDVHDGMKLTAVNNAGSKSSVLEVASTNPTATFTNTRDYSELSIYKSVNSSLEADHNAFYNYTARFTYSTNNGSELLAHVPNRYKLTYYDKDGKSITSIPTGATGLPTDLTSLPEYLTLDSGIGTVYVYAGGYTKIEKLPVGTSYTLIENIDSAFRANRTQADGIILKDSSAASNVENFTNTRITGDLHVSKNVISNTSTDKSQLFDFQVTLKKTADGAADTTINGDYGKYREETGVETNIHFTNGVATFKAKDQDEVVISGLPVGIYYEVKETNSHGLVVTQTGQIGTINGGIASTAAFTNIHDEGGLIISKSVKSDLERDKTREFKFKVQMFNAEENNESVASNKNYAQADGTSYTTNYEGYIIFDPSKSDGEELIYKLHDGQTLLINNLPVGAKYIVTEESDPDFKTTIVGNGTVEGGSITGHILKNSANLAEFINERKTSALKIKKTVVSPITADLTKTFKFNIKLYDEVASGTTGEDVFTEGGKTYKYLTATIAGRYFDGANGADFFVMGTQELRLEGIPADVYYIVTENEDPSFTVITPENTNYYKGPTSASNGDQDNCIELPFVNKRNDATLMLSKTVESAVETDKSIPFTYTILFNESINDYFTVTITGDVGGLASTNKEGQSGKFLKVENGRATVTLKHGATLTVNGLPTGTTYTVVETANNDFTAYWQNNASGDWTEGYETTGTVDTDPVPVANFKNVRKTGKLELKKIVNSTVRSDKTEKEFTFNITFDRILDDTNDITLEVDGTERTFELKKVKKVIDNTEKDVSAITGIKIKDNQIATLEGLPVGMTYWIEEVEADQGGFVTTYTGETGTISANTARATFTNTKQVGGLIISKSVVSPVTTDHSEEFHYTIVFSGKSPAELGVPNSGNKKEFGSLELQNVDGTTVMAEFTLKDGDSEYVTDLPDGTNYTITETPVSYMINETPVYYMEAKNTVATMDEQGKQGSVKTNVGNNGLTASDTVYSGATDVVAYTNTRATEKLTISKSVVSDNPADKGRDYSFTVTLNVGDNPLPGTFGGITFDENGQATIKLHGDDSVVLPDLPVGTTYKIEESEQSAAGFTVNPNTRTIGGIIELNKPATADFTNTRETGNLTITKTVSSSLSDDATTREYNFHIYLDSDISKTYNTTTRDKTVTFTNGVSEAISLKDGEYLTIQGLPTGVHYIVEEETIEGMTVTYNGDASINGSGTITKSDPTEAGQTVSVTNTRITKPLEIIKSVFVNDENKTTEYKDSKVFYVKVKAEIGGLTYWVTKANGELTKNDPGVKPYIFPIKPGTEDNHKVVIDGLPLGKYTVYEVVKNNSEATNVGTGAPPETDMGNMLFVAELSTTEDTVTLSSQTADHETAKLVNKYTSEKFCVAVTKNWVDDGNKYNTRPDSLTVTLKRYTKDTENNIIYDKVNNKDWERTVTLNAANNWSAMVTGVEQFNEEGQKLYYEWIESGVSNYAAGVQQKAQVDEYARSTEQLVLITKLNNSLVNVDIPVQKIVTGNTYTGDEEFTITLTQKEKSNGADDPAKVLVNGIEATANPAQVKLHRHETGTFTLQGIKTPGTYTYTIKESSGTTPGMTYAADQDVTIVVEFRGSREAGIPGGQVHQGW